MNLWEYAAQTAQEATQDAQEGAERFSIAPLLREQERRTEAVLRAFDSLSKVSDYCRGERRKRHSSNKSVIKHRPCVPLRGTPYIFNRGEGRSYFIESR